MVRKFFILMAITGCFTAQLAFAEEESSSSNSESAQDHFDKAKDHLIEGCIDAVAAGASITHGPLGVAIAVYETIEASKNFTEAAKEYNEGKRIEAESNADCGKDDYDRSHDHDSWDRDY